jgi:hypothetical protein
MTRDWVGWHDEYVDPESALSRRVDAPPTARPDPGTRPFEFRS